MRVTWRGVGLVAQSLLYVAAGVNHFWHSRTYVAIMPPHYSHPLGWVQFTGLAEIAGGFGLLAPQTRRAAAWGIVAMLLVYFDVHISMVLHAERFSNVPLWALYLRLPVQFLLIAGALFYARKRAPHHS